MRSLAVMIGLLFVLGGCEAAGPKGAACCADGKKACCADGAKKGCCATAACTKASAACKCACGAEGKAGDMMMKCTACGTTAKVADQAKACACGEKCVKAGKMDCAKCGKECDATLCCAKCAAK